MFDLSRICSRAALDIRRMSPPSATTGGVGSGVAVGIACATDPVTTAVAKARANFFVLMREASIVVGKTVCSCPTAPDFMTRSPDSIQAIGAAQKIL